MGALQIRNLSEPVYQRIKELSEQEHRSLSSQALVLLEQALSGKEAKNRKRRETIAELKQSEENWPEEKLPGPEKLLAEDRRR